MSDGLTLLEVFSNIPDHRRAEGKRFPLAPVLLYCVIAMIAGANFYRRMHSFIAAHLGPLNAAFGTDLRCAPSYCGLRLILRGVDPNALEAAFRQHAQGLSPQENAIALRLIAIDDKTLRGSFYAFSDVKAVHMLSALNVADKIVLAHVMIDEKSNEIPAAQALYTPCARKVVSGFRKKRTERKHWYTHTPDSSGVWVYYLTLQNFGPC